MIINWLWYPIFGFSKHEKDAKFVFYENMLGKILGFGRMLQKKIFFYVFENGNWFKSFWDFFLNVLNLFFFNILEKTGYFNTGFVFYSVNIQPDIMQNL
jgi:hypothetical protein